MKIIFLIGYFLFLISFGIYSLFWVKKNDDFYAAGKKNGVLGITGSLLATILGGSAIIGTSNLSFSRGWASAWWILCGVIGLIVLLPMAKLVKRYGKYTLPQMLGDFYGRPVEVISSVVISIAWIGIVAAQIIAASKIIFTFFGLPYIYGVLISGGVFIIYTILGGQYSIIKTDMFQFGLILSGILILSFFSLNKIGFNISNLTDLKFPFNKNFNQFDLLILFLTLSTTYFVGPDIYSRLFCAKDEKTAVKSVLLSIIILLPFAFFLSFLGVFTKSNFNVDIKQTSAIVVLSQNILPKWGVGIITAALLSAVMSSADTTLLTGSLVLSEIFIDVENKKSIILTRVLIAVIGILSIIFAIFVKNIISSLLIALTIFSGAFIIPTIAGLFKYRTNAIQIISAILAGGLIAFIGKIFPVFLKIRNAILIGNIIIIIALLLNALILFFPFKKIFGNKT